MNGNRFWLRAALTLAVLIAIVFVILILTGCGERTDDDANKVDPLEYTATTIPAGDPLEQRAVTFQLEAVERIAYVVTLDFAAKVEQARYDEAQRQRVAAAIATTDDNPDTTPDPVVVQGGNGACGGSLPPCSVKQRESGGNYSADNPRSSACGAWQIIDSTWDNYGGYDTACDAPAEVQDAKAAELWADGAGCAHWAETDGC